MSELPRKYSSFAIVETVDLEGYILVQPSTPGSELVRIKISDLLAQFLSEIP
jgi:hypothetical protein